MRVDDGVNAPALTDVVVAVMNVNDLQPVFQRGNYSFVVTENTDCSHPLGQVCVQVTSDSQMRVPPL